MYSNTGGGGGGGGGPGSGGGGGYYSSGSGHHRRPQPSSIHNTIMSMNATKSNFSTNNLRTAELQKEKKAAAASRRQEQQLREAAKDDLYEAGSGLFGCPQKVHADPQSQIVNQVLGPFENTVINTASCIGIDYQPQTPAPAQHIIGEEDEIPKSKRPPTLTRPNGSRLPENISQTDRPTARNNSLSHPSSSRVQPPLSAMLPPPAPPRSSKNNNPYNHPSSTFLPPHPSNNHPPKKPGESNKQRPKTSSSSSRSNSNNVELEEKKVQDMIRQMLDPISGNNNQMPALLSAIVTPSITEHEGNNNRSVPRYLPTPGLQPPIGKISPLHGTSKPNLSEESDSDKEEMEPPAKMPVKNSPPAKITNNSDSNSTAESSSDDSSESEDEEERVGEVKAQEDSNEDEDEFSLANLAKKANLSKFSPSSNPATVHKENSPAKKIHHLEQSVPPAHNEKSPPDVDIDFISGLLTTSTPDINLDFVGTSIDRPISPMKQSPEHEDVVEDISPPTPPPPPKIKEPVSSGSSRPSSRRRSSANTSNSTPVMLDSSDEECMLLTKRAPRTKKSRTKKEEPQSKKAKSHRRSSSSKRKLSSEDEDDDDDKDAKMFLSSDSSVRHIPLEGTQEKLQSEDTSPVAASNKKKNMALGNIFGVKTSSSKGGGKGKAGIKVEVIERQSNENPSNLSSTTTVPSPIIIMESHQAVTKDKPSKPEIAIVQPRPRLLCRIPLRSLNHSLPHLSRRHHNHPRTTNTIENLNSRRNLFDDDEEECKGKNMTDVKMQTSIDNTNTSVKRRSKSSVSADPHAASSKRLKLEAEEDASNKMSEYLVEQNNKCMMPPPSKRSSYLESKDEEDDNEEEHNFCMSEAKRLKDEADKERDREQQAMKYIQAVLYFILCGNITERNGDKHLALVMYNETLSFIRDVCRPFKNSEFGNFDNKLAALSLRCQSLLYLKMYKLTQNEYRECQKIIGEHIMKASQQNSPNSNTPSPAGSDGSRSSGYTSSGEINNGGGGSSSRYTGVATPPTTSLTGTSSSHNLIPQCLTVPQNVMKKHFQYGTYLTQCHDLWEQADMYLHRGHCEEFIKRLDRMCGPLTLHSSLKDLVKYIRTGLNFWSKEREEALVASGSMSS